MLGHTPSDKSQTLIFAEAELDLIGTAGRFKDMIFDMIEINHQNILIINNDDMIGWFYDQMMIWFDMMMIPDINQMI